jgi:hypothetical protein
MEAARRRAFAPIGSASWCGEDALPVRTSNSAVAAREKAQERKMRPRKSIAVIKNTRPVSKIGQRF